MLSCTKWGGGGGGEELLAGFELGPRGAQQCTNGLSAIGLNNTKSPGMTCYKFPSQQTTNGLCMCVANSVCVGICSVKEKARY